MNHHFRKIIRNWLYPRDRLCLACLHPLDYDETPDGILCLKCAEALGDLSEAQSLAEEAPGSPIAPGLKSLHCAFPYQDQAKMLVYQLKYYHVRRAAVPLAAAMKNLPAGDADLVLPMPTTRRRKWERGYNQTELIAAPFASAHKIEVHARLLRRIDDAASQTKVTSEERRKNVIGSMRAGSEVSGRKVLLIDDVYTTGSTAAEAVRALNEAGCTDIRMLAVCRAGQKQDDVDLPF